MPTACDPWPGKMNATFDAIIDATFDASTP
jgi:hypothetical protein